MQFVFKSHVAIREREFCKQKRYRKRLNKVSSLDFQTSQVSDELFKTEYDKSNYSVIHHRWLRSCVALIPTTYHLIQAIFFTAMASIVEISYRLNLSKKGSRPLQLFFRAKCHLYISRGHLHSGWNTKAGLKKIHRGNLEQWKNGSSTNLLEIITKNFPKAHQQKGKNLSIEYVNSNLDKHKINQTLVANNFFYLSLTRSFYGDNNKTKKKNDYLLYSNQVTRH